jgi:hypothetical protein
MTTVSVSEFSSKLTETIKSKDASASLLLIQQFKELMKDPSVGSEYVIWITEPGNLSSLHRILIENLNIHPRLLAIKRVSSSRTLKAVLLVQAVELAIKKVHSL